MFWNVTLFVFVKLDEPLGRLPFGPRAPFLTALGPFLTASRPFSGTGPLILDDAVGTPLGGTFLPDPDSMTVTLSG